MKPFVLVLLTDQTSSVLVRGQLRYLIDHGFRVEVATSIHDTESSFDPGVVVHPIPFVRAPSPLADLRALVHTTRLMRRLRPDLVTASTPKAGLLGMIAARMTRIPVRVYHVRGLRYETAKGLPRRVYRTLENVSMRLATHVLFNAPSVRAVAERDGLLPRDRGLVLGSGSGNGVDTDRFRPSSRDHRQRHKHVLGMPPDALVLGFVGRLTRDKGVDDVIDVFTRVSDPSATTRESSTPWLLLVGSFESDDALDANTMRVIATHPRIVHLDWVDDTAPIYAAVDILVFASYREGLPNVVLEAQSSGLPVIAYAATGTVDAIADDRSGRLVPIGDRDALEREVRSLIASEHARTTLGEAARVWVQSTFARERVWESVATSYRDWLTRDS